MCNRFRSIEEWSEIPRDLYIGPRLNFEYNPNVAPTETVPALIAGAREHATWRFLEFFYRQHPQSEHAGGLCTRHFGCFSSGVKHGAGGTEP